MAGIHLLSSLILTAMTCVPGPSWLPWMWS